MTGFPSSEEARSDEIGERERPSSFMASLVMSWRRERRNTRRKRTTSRGPTMSGFEKHSTPIMERIRKKASQNSTTVTGINMSATPRSLAKRLTTRPTGDSSKKLRGARMSLEIMALWRR